MLLIDVVLKTEAHPAYSPTSYKVKFNFKSNEAAGRAVIAFIYPHVASFAISWATPARVVPAEIFPMISRGRSNNMNTGLLHPHLPKNTQQLTLSLARNRLVNFWFALYIATALNTLSWKMYIIFTAICFCAVVWTWALQLETANCSLEEMVAISTPGRIRSPLSDRHLRCVWPKKESVERHKRLAILDESVGAMEKQDASDVENLLDVRVCRRA